MGDRVGEILNGKTSCFNIRLKYIEKKKLII